MWTFFVNPPQVLELETLSYFDQKLAILNSRTYDTKDAAKDALKSCIFTDIIVTKEIIKRRHETLKEVHTETVIRMYRRRIKDDHNRLRQLRQNYDNLIANFNDL